MAWMKHGGGGKLRDELYEPYGLVSIICGAMPELLPGIRTLT
jgi:TRAP-type mannitol/chloroaromatic compound transport system substrate-binding protein